MFGLNQRFLSFSVYNFSYKKTQINTAHPSFYEADEAYAARNAKISVQLHLRSPWRWTPLIQKVQQQEEFLKKMRYFQKLQFFEDKHRKELIDAFIFEALKGTEFDYYYDYYCNPSKASQYHGMVDFMIYNKQSPNKLPIIPIIQINKLGFKSPVLKEREINNGPSLAAAQWALLNMYAMEKISNAYVIQTNGNHWRMIKLGIDGSFEKTGFYYSTTNQFEKIYYDYDQQQVVLGMIKFSLGLQTQNEKALKVIYDFVDERRFLSQPSEQEKLDYKKSQKFWSFLPKSIHDLFFQN